jgi:hypothetical protein
VTRDEFIEIHGEQAWDTMVRPRNRPGSEWPFAERCNANVLVCAEINKFVIDLGLPRIGLILAKEVWETLHPGESWDKLLSNTIFSSEYYNRRLIESRRVFEE